jgi:hypothetical protein
MVYEACERPERAVWVREGARLPGMAFKACECAKL